MRRLGVAALLLIVAATALGVLVAGSSDQRSLAFTLGVRPGPIATSLGGGDIACQGPIDVAADFERVVFSPSPEGDSVPVSVTIREADGLRVISRGQGLLGDGDSGIQVDGVDEGKRVQICAENTGRAELELAGNAAQAHMPSTLHVNGRPSDHDLTLLFARREGASPLATLPDVIDRASLFKGGLAPPWVLWILLGAVLVAVPAVLAAAIGALRDPGRDTTSGYPPAG